jgi:hypothetical protein
LKSLRMRSRPSSLDSDIGFHDRFPFYANQVLLSAVHFHECHLKEDQICNKSKISHFILLDSR